jgi:hypothetical protein
VIDAAAEHDRIIRLHIPNLRGISHIDGVARAAQRGSNGLRDFAGAAESTSDGYQDVHCSFLLVRGQAPRNMPPYRSARIVSPKGECDGEWR